MRLLLFGGTGQLGTELRSLAVTAGIDVTAPTESVVGLKDEKAVGQIVAAESWDAVINAAAYTNVDGAESDEPAAFAVNATAAGLIAVETARHRIPLIHISTDYVFDGRKGAPYVETDTPAPLNAYGRSKLAGELAVRAANPQHVILRTAWLYSPYGKNFVRTILRLARERERLTIVSDQRGCPTAARDVAKACIEIAQRCVRQPNQVAYGTYHFAGGGEASWFEFATAIVQMAADRLPRVPQVMPIQTSDYPSPAVRPADTRLDCTAVLQNFSVTLRDWRFALVETIERLQQRVDAA